MLEASDCEIYLESESESALVEGGAPAPSMTPIDTTCFSVYLRGFATGGDAAEITAAISNLRNVVDRAQKRERSGGGRGRLR